MLFRVMTPKERRSRMEMKKTKLIRRSPLLPKLFRVFVDADLVGLHQ